MAMRTGHAGTGRTGGTGVMHGKGASVSRVGMLRKERERERENDGKVQNKKE